MHFISGNNKRQKGGGAPAYDWLPAAGRASGKALLPGSRWLGLPLWYCSMCSLVAKPPSARHCTAQIRIQGTSSRQRSSQYGMGASGIKISFLYTALGIWRRARASIILIARLFAGASRILDQVFVDDSTLLGNKPPPPFPHALGHRGGCTTWVLKPCDPRESVTWPWRISRTVKQRSNLTGPSGLPLTFLR